MDDPGPLLELYDRLHRGQRLDNLSIRADCGSTRRQATRDLRLMDDALGACLVRVREGAGKAWWALQDGVHRQAVLPEQVLCCGASRRPRRARTAWRPSPSLRRLLAG